MITIRLRGEDLSICDAVMVALVWIVIAMIVVSLGLAAIIWMAGETFVSILNCKPRRTASGKSP